MSLLKIFAKVADKITDDIIDKNKNRRNKRTSQIKDSDVLYSYNKSNESIDNLRKSIQNTKQ